MAIHKILLDSIILCHIIRRKTIKIKNHMSVRKCMKKCLSIVILLVGPLTIIVAAYANIFAQVQYSSDTGSDYCMTII